MADDQSAAPEAGADDHGHDGEPWWVLRGDERALVAAKRPGTRLDFAVLLAFFRACGRFPRTPAEVGAEARAALAAQLDGAAAAPGAAGDDPADPSARTSARSRERYRADVRAHFGFREATADDAERLTAWLTAWLRVQAVPETRDRRRLTAAIEAECRRSRVEPPTPERADRIVRAAVRAHEEALYARTHARLPDDVRTALDLLLQPPGDGAADGADGRTPAGDAAVPDAMSDGGGAAATAARAAPAALTALRADPGRASLASVREQLGRLAAVRALALPENLFADARPHELPLYRQRVAVEAPYELRRHPDAARLTWLAAYAHLRGRQLTDGLVDLLTETVHHIGARAERRVERELLDDLKRVAGKQSLLFQLADAALARPEGTVREVVFPVVTEATLRDLMREWKATGPTYRTTLRTAYRGRTMPPSSAGRRCSRPCAPSWGRGRPRRRRQDRRPQGLQVYSTRYSTGCSWAARSSARYRAHDGRGGRDVSWHVPHFGGALACPTFSVSSSRLR